MLANLNSSAIDGDRATCRADTDFDAVIIENTNLDVYPDAIGRQPTWHSQNLTGPSLLLQGTNDVVDADNLRGGNITENRYLSDDTNSYYLENDGSMDFNVEDSILDSNSFEDTDGNDGLHSRSYSNTIHVMVEDPRRGVVTILHHACTIDHYFNDNKNDALATPDSELERAAQHVPLEAVEETNLDTYVAL